MDILNLIKPKDWLTFAENYNYKRDFMGQKLFPAIKTADLDVSVMQLAEGGNVPVMAMVHSLDAEAHIGDRANPIKFDYKKLLIKEKVNHTERIAEYLKNASENEVMRFILDDANNMMSRVLTRAEVANMEVLGTGKATYKENNVNYSVDYQVNKGSCSGWNQPDHDILGDINTAITVALQKGYKISRAITSSKILTYILGNAKVADIFAKRGEYLSIARLQIWLKDTFGVEFVVNDGVYKTSAQASSTHRFYPENNITYLGTNGIVGKGMYGFTPEELELDNTSTKNNITITQWKTPDPVAVWTKASALYVPVLKDNKSVFVYTHSEG